MDLSIIIINWNSAAYLRECLRSIRRAQTRLAYEIIVVDNASSDGCEEFAGDTFGEITFVQSGRNLGFPRANNLGFQYATGKALLFLNPDTIVSENTVDTMFAQLMADDGAGAIGCKLLNSDGSVQTSCIQAFPTLANQTLNADALRRLFPRAKLWGMQPLFTESLPAAVPVDVISGACLMVKQQVFEQVGCFSAEYFMYSDDVDLCFKIRRHGLKCLYTNRATVIHHGGGSTGKNAANFDAFIQFQESRFRFFRKARGSAYAAAYKIIISVVAAARLLAIGLARGCSRLSRKKRRFYFSLQKWKSILRWSLGLTKPYSGS